MVKINRSIHVLFTSMMFVTMNLIVGDVQAQDHSIDVGYQYFKVQPVSQADGRKTEYNLTSTTLGYTGYIGFWNASEFRIGLLQGDIDIEDTSPFARDTNYTIETDGLQFGYVNWNFINEELNGFGIGYGLDVGVTKEVFIGTGHVEACYRIPLGKSFSLTPSLFGRLGYLFERDTSLFDASFFGFSYGAAIRLSYNFN